jgi:hypothetical protein
MIDETLDMSNDHVKLGGKLANQKRGATSEKPA